MYNFYSNWSQKINVLKRMVIVFFKIKIISLFLLLEKKLTSSSPYFVRNLGLIPNKKGQYRILISYTNDIFGPQDKLFHSNSSEALVILKYFIDKGFIVDCINCEFLVPEFDYDCYDVIFGLGANYRKAIENNMKSLKICYLTENHPDFVKKQIAIRNNYFYDRTGLINRYNRIGLFKTEDINNSDFIISMLSEYSISKNNWNNLPHLTIKPTALFNEKFTYNVKSFDVKRLNFLWFGSYGAVHKGLDILLDLFKERSDINLHVAGLYEQERHLFRKYTSLDNIHFYDYIDVNSDSFLDIVEKCGWVILPSCAEGCSTSVLTCMAHGLIPIITRETGVDYPELVFFLDSYKVEDINDKIINLLDIEDSVLIKKSYDNYVFGREHFSINRFSNQFGKLMDDILLTSEMF